MKRFILSAMLLMAAWMGARAMSFERAQAEVAHDGMLLDSSVIPNPDKRLWDTIL